MKTPRSSILGCTTAVLWLCAMSDSGSAADLAVADLTVADLTVADLAVAEATVRKADADWAAAMAGNGVEAWMSFYSADAIVLLPNNQLADGTDLVRRSVTRLLAPPHRAVAWHSTKVQLSRSGDVAYLAGVYEVRS